MRKMILMAAAAALTATLAGCNAPAASSTAAAASSAVKTPASWDTSESTDEMSNVKTRSASIYSTDKFSNSLGRDDKASEITVRVKGKHPEVILENSNLQILCNEYSRPLRVKFDTGKPQTFSCSEASTGNFGLGFINAAPRFIAGLRKAKSMIIEAEVYQHGPVAMHFDVPPMPSTLSDSHVAQASPKKHHGSPDPDEALAAATEAASKAEQ
jgi:hypothetical protein